MNRLLLLVLLAISMAGCEENHIELAHKAIKKNLHYPDRASFKEDKKYLKDDGHNVVVCGWVNAWNRMEGYGGHRRYIVDGDYAEVISQDNVSDFNGKDLEVCKG